MSLDAFPISLADESAISVLCRNSLTDRQVQAAQAALRHLDPAWSLDCCESCDADLFLDLASVQPDGRAVSFIIHARDGTVHALRMIQDDITPLGNFDDVTQAVRAVVAAIETGPD